MIFRAIQKRVYYSHGGRFPVKPMVFRRRRHEDIKYSTRSFHLRSEYLRTIFLQITYAPWKTNRSEENRSRNVGDVSESERHDECKLESES